MALAALALGALLGPAGLPHTVVCPMRRWTGLPCPGCGLTHGFCALCRGQVGLAWHENPFAFVFFAGAVLLALAPLLRRILPGPATGWLSRAPPAWTFAALVLLMWAWDAFRIVAALHA